ncbi:MAG TPA: LamG-like jellyroll fold domain-containing protein, partial [Kofleriaceae bacterium]|nr:LamG-like jellyroll fold domain-containing protein [Kofleriaceae bacterium]
MVVASCSAEPGTLHRRAELSGEPSGSSFGLAFDGVDDTLRSIDSLGHGLSTAVTAEYWVMPSSRVWMKLLNVHNGENRDVDMEIRPDGHMYCTLYDQVGRNHGTTSTSILTLGAWYHIACSYDGSAQRVFVNGALEAQSAWVGQVQLDDAITISGFESRFMHGVVDEFRLAASATYTSDFAPPDHLELSADTLALWRFDEGAGSLSADASGNGHVAVLGAAGSGSAPEWVSTPPRVHYGLQFDGTTDTLASQSRLDFGLVPELTAEYWFRP